jgi:hypothetical protein
MVLPFNPFTTSNYGGQGIIDDGFVENTSLAATPGYEATVVKVSDDAPVGESAPDTNFDDDSGGITLAVENFSGNIALSWLKFNLTHIPDNLHFNKATVNLFAWSSAGSTDYPIGVYYSEINTWTEESLTWNNQPAYNAIPAAVIDSPASPDMFVVGNWYEWEITTEVIQTLEQDGILSLAIRLVDEDTPTNTILSFASRETCIVNSVGYTPYVSLEYAVPTTTDLLVDGFSESPQIDYINNENPDFSWTFNDADTDDFQKNYELEVWNNSGFDDTQLMHANNSESTVVHDTGGAGSSAPGDTFNSPFEVRWQYKWPSDMISQSGFVDKLFIEMDVLSGTTTYYDLAIYMLGVEDSSDLTTDFQSNYDGRTPIQVLNRSEFTGITENGFMVFDIENSFVLSSSLNLIIEFRHSGGVSGTSLTSNFTNSGGSVAFRAESGAYHHSTASGSYTQTHGLQLELVSQDVYSGGSQTNVIPFGLNLGVSGRFQFKYNQSLINDEGIIDKILFPAGKTGDVTYENFSVYLVETPLEGALEHTDLNSNYAGVTPTLVLSTDEYVVRDVGGILVIDVNDLFFYTNTQDLLVELRFDSFVSGDQRAVYALGGGGYRAYDTTPYFGNDTATVNMLLEFIYETNSVEYTGSPMANATTYYWRVRTYDSSGIWSPWESASFKYEVLESIPGWSNLVETASPIELGESMTISINVTHITEIKQVLIEYGGTNHTMSKSGDSFSHTWTPDSAGTLPYTVYMEPNSGVWTTVSDSVGVVDTTAPAWVPAPADKVLEYGEMLSYQLTATDLSGIASWVINDTINFDITDGLVTNRVALAPGAYRLNVTVTDTEGNSISGTFIVAVLDSSTTPTTTPTQPTPFDSMGWIIAALAGVIVVLIIIIVVQSRKS